MLFILIHMNCHIQIFLAHAQNMFCNKIIMVSSRKNEFFSPKTEHKFSKRNNTRLIQKREV